MENWIMCENEDSNIILSTRVRLARNLKGYPFPNKISKEKAEEVIAKVKEVLLTNDYLKGKINILNLSDINDIEKDIYFENHLISKKLIENKEISALAIDDKEIMSIMINEEDHVRLQLICGGLHLKELYEEVNKMDDILEEKLDFAYDANLGYLTACPTNTGTGLRASVMLHLPALCMTKEIDNIFAAIGKVGITIRGMYGEGSKGYGSIFQISNQITLGQSEDEIINGLTAMIYQIIEKENLARKQLKEQYNYEIQNKVMRALGILKSAIILDYRECMELLSLVRLGNDLGFIENVNKELLNRLMIQASVPVIKSKFDEDVRSREINIYRAKIFREQLKDM